MINKTIITSANITTCDFSNPFDELTYQQVLHIKYYHKYKCCSVGLIVYLYSYSRSLYLNVLNRPVLDPYVMVSQLETNEDKV